MMKTGLSVISLLKAKTTNNSTSSGLKLSQKKMKSKSGSKASKRKASIKKALYDIDDISKVRETDYGYEIIISGLPKISLNDFYESKHWTSRLQIKDAYKQILSKKFGKLMISGICIVDYEFAFKSNPLDWDNCAAMVKMIQDVLFANDKWSVIQQGTIRSIKGKEEIITLNVYFL